MRSILPAIRDVLGEHYGLQVTDIRRLWSGTTGVHAQATTSTGAVFVKTYRLRADFTYELLNIDTVRRWIDAGIPGAAPVATGHGAWMHRQRGLAMSVWQWVDASPAEHLTAAQATAVGETLAGLHRLLDRLDLPRLPVNREHPRTTPDRQITDRFQQLLHHLHTNPQAAGDVDAERVHRRLRQLRQLPQLRAGLPPARLGRVHGDLASPNLLFDGDRLAAIIDPRVQLADRSREIGRIAFDPHTVAARPDWLDIGLACIAGYLHAGGPVLSDEIIACARLALLHSLTSTYPLEDSLIRREPPRARAQQARYWADRCTTVDRLLPALAEIEHQLAALTAAHGRHPATAGRPS